MGASIEPKYSYIRYDLKLDEYIDLHEFDGELVINFQLPYILPRLNDSFCIEVENRYAKIPFLFLTKRYIAFSGTRHCISNQNVFSAHSTIGISSKGNTILTTSLSLAIELSKDEVKESVKYFNSENIEVFIKDIIQDSLEIILHKYNEQAEGVSFASPTYFDCDHLYCNCLINYIRKRKVFWEYISPNDISANKDYLDETSIERSSMKNDIITWKYYYNKSNFQYNNREFLESIISAAIAVESFALGTVRTHFTTDIDEISYTSEKITLENGEESKKYLSTTKLIKKLKKSQYISIELSNSQIEATINKILKPRNDIMHGKISISKPLKTEAQNVHESLALFFSSIHIEKISITNSSENSSDDYKKYCYLLDSAANDDIILEEKLKNIDEAIAIYPKIVNGYITKAELYIKNGEISSICDVLKEALSFSKHKASILVEICILLCSLDRYKHAFNILSKLSDQEHNDRSYTLMAFIEYNFYKRGNGKQHYLNSYNFLKKAIGCNFNYPLTNYLGRILTLEVKDYQNSLFGAQRMINQDNQDYESLLFAAEMSIIINDYPAALDFFLKFIVAYSGQTYAIHLIEFMSVNIDPKVIFSRMDVVRKLIMGQSNLTLTDDQKTTLALCDSFISKELSGIHVNLSSPYQFTPSKDFSPHLIKMTIPDLYVLGEVKDAIKMNGCFAGPC